MSLFACLALGGVLLLLLLAFLVLIFSIWWYDSPYILLLSDNCYCYAAICGA